MAKGSLRHTRRSMARRVLFPLLISMAVLTLAVFIAFQVSPWPSTLLIRRAFNKDGIRTNKALEKHVPPGIVSITDEQYDRDDNDAFMDIYFPGTLTGTATVLPTIIWIHGGGWVAGDKKHVGNYCKILASKGYTVVSIDYSLAPGKKYPTPVRQANTALGYLAQHAERLHVDTSRFVLAGDSGGAHIAAQLACITGSPEYARLLNILPSVQPEQLAGVILYCGPYDARHVNLDGDFGKFLKTVLWAYSGTRDFMSNSSFATVSVINYVTAAFPPAFISAGNGDPLVPHSQELARILGDSLGTRVDTLFFSPSYQPALPHEYQFNLDTDAGRVALERSLVFLKGIGQPVVNSN